MQPLDCISAPPLSSFFVTRVAVVFETSTNLHWRDAGASYLILIGFLLVIKDFQSPSGASACSKS
jgi:hypothetical protein